MEKGTKKKGKKGGKKIAAPMFNADINLDEEQPDIPEKVEKIEVDEISIVNKIESKGDAQQLIEVKEEKAQPFCIDESQDITRIHSGKAGDGQVNEQGYVPPALVQNIIPQELIKPITQEHPLQQQRKQQQTSQPQLSENLYSHTFQPIHLTASLNEKQVETHPQQQPRQIQKKAEIKKIAIEDEEQDQLAQSLKEDPKSKVKVKKTAKKPKTKAKTGTSTIFVLENIVDLDDFNDIQEVKAKSQIIPHVEQKKQDTINTIIESRQPQVVNNQERIPAELQIAQNTVNEVIVEAQFKQEPLEHVQLKNTIEQEEKPAQVAILQDKEPLYSNEQQKTESIKQQIVVRQQAKVEVKEEIIPVRNIQEEVESEIVMSLQDSKPKPKSLKKNTKKGGKKQKVDKNIQIMDDNILEIEEIQQNELPKLAQTTPETQPVTVKEVQKREEQQQKVEEKIVVIEPKHEQIEPTHVLGEQRQEEAIEQLHQSKDNKETQQKQIIYKSQQQSIESEPTITQQPVIIAQKKPITEQPALEPQKEEVPVVKKEVEEDEDLIVVSFAEQSKPKHNKTTKKPTKKAKGKAKEEKNATIGESMLNFDQEIVKIQQPPKHEKKIDRAEEIPSKVIEKRQTLQQQIKAQPSEQIVLQPLSKIAEPHVIQQTSFTKLIEKPQQPQVSPTTSSTPQSKKEIVSQLISLIRFHNDQEIKTMRQRMQMLQQDILSRMGRSKASTIRAPSKNTDYQWIIEQNIALHGQYNSLNKI